MRRLGSWLVGLCALAAVACSTPAEGDGGAVDVSSAVDVPVDLGGGEGDLPLPMDEPRAGDVVAPEPDMPATPSTLGSPCVADDSCPAGGSGTATCLTEWPNGYCAVEGCSTHGHDCPGDAGNGGTSGSKCVKAPTPICLLLCDADADCRAGYACASKVDAAGHGSANVCVPK